MRVYVATGNPVKVRGARRAVSAFFPDAEVQGTPWEAPRAGMPVGAEVFRGAERRAAAALAAGADLGIGVESGLVRFPGLPERFLLTVACAVGEGAVGWGTSAAFPLPRDIGPDPEAGIVGALTGGRMVRRDLVYQAVLLALASWRRG